MLYNIAFYLHTGTGTQQLQLYVFYTSSNFHRTIRKSVRGVELQEHRQIRTRRRSATQLSVMICVFSIYVTIHQPLRHVQTCFAIVLYLRTDYRRVFIHALHTMVKFMAGRSQRHFVRHSVRTEISADHFLVLPPVRFINIS